MAGFRVKPLFPTTALRIPNHKVLHLKVKDPPTAENPAKPLFIMMKTNEETLVRKREYYQKNKEKILARKHERNPEIYLKKKERELTPEEYEKEQMRRLSRKYEEKKGECMMCGAMPQILGYPLERHHPDYAETEVWWLCKPCHAKCDMERRRLDEKK